MLNIANIRVAHTAIKNKYNMNSTSALHNNSRIGKLKGILKRMG